jgi:2-polyprenyl-6-hydroxyphenyl methylase / 3-demethylubiquinone-9 3-methyltransferase
MENKSLINNELYNTLGERWYTAFDDPVALLRQESKTKIPWVLEKVKALKPSAEKLKVLDVGCGAGFLSNRLATEGFDVHGIDLSHDSLCVAAKYDVTRKVKYQEANAYKLPFADAQFDVVTAMDFLEHVEDPEKVVQEVSRVLKPGGLFFFHTFNRNWLAYLVIIKLVEFLVKNTPKHMHVLNLFIKPEELERFCNRSQMQVLEMTGIRPRFSTITLKSLLTRTVPENFAFALTPSLKLSYLGLAQKKIDQVAP